jgi:hypothetical protein
MGKTTKQARKVSPPTSAAAKVELLRKAQANSAKASAPVTAADVWRFNNAEDVQASNALVGSTIADTLESCSWVLAFLSDFHVRKPCSEMNEDAEAGLVLVIDWVLDAVEKQANQLEVHHG